jgi:hypothetical protein
VWHFIYCYAECHFLECRYAECHNNESHYAKCHHAECRGTFYDALNVSIRANVKRPMASIKIRQHIIGNVSKLPFARPD